VDEHGAVPHTKSPAWTGSFANVNAAPVPPVLDPISPGAGQGLRASGLADEDGLPEAGETLQWLWQTAESPGGPWTTVATRPYNVTGFIPTEAHVGLYLRVVAEYTDDLGTAESVASLPTNLIGGPPP